MSQALQIAPHEVGHTQRTGRSSARRSAVTLAVSGLLGLWGLIALANWLLVQNAIAQAQATAQNTGVMAAAYVKQSLDAGALVLHGMQALLSEKSVQNEEDYRAFLEGPAATQALRDRIANMKEVDKAAFIGRNGDILNFSVVYPPPPINVADRDYFREQMGEAPPDRSLSAAVLDRSSGKWTFFLAQRVTGSMARGPLLAHDRGSSGSGGPFGLAIVGIRASLLSDFLGQNRLGDSSVVLLLRDDDVLLAGAGVPPAAYGRKFANAIAALRSSSADILASEPVAGFPARIVVLGGPADDTKILRESLPMTLALGGLVSVGILLALWRTLRLITRIASPTDRLG